MKSASKTPVIRAGVRALGALVVLSPLAVGACEVGNPAGDQASTGASAPSVVSSPARPARGFAEHVPAPVATRAARVVRPVDRTATMRLLVQLQRPHAAEENQLALDIGNPSSPRFRQFLTMDQYVARFVLGDDDVAKVEAWANGAGLREVTRFRDGALVLDGDVATVERALGVHVNEYEHQGRHFYANDRAPTLPSSIASLVDDVDGLDSYEQLGPVGHASWVDMPSPQVSSEPFVARSELAVDAVASVAAAKPRRPDFGGAGGDLIEPPDLWSPKAYGYQSLNHLSSCCNPTNNPVGPRETSIAIVGGLAPSSSDLLTFFQGYNLAAQITIIHLSGNHADSDGEMTLDTEYADAMSNSFGSSTSTAHLYVYAAPSFKSGDLKTAWHQALQDNSTRVATTSFGAAEDQVSIGGYHSIFTSMAILGWTMLGDAGDHGATQDCSTLSVNFPASDPLFVSVGGTTLALDDPSGFFAGEPPWNGPGCNGNPSANFGGGGGGCSSDFFMPPWQYPLPEGMTGSSYVGIRAQQCDVTPFSLVQQTIPPAHPIGPPFGARSVPDIALNAGSGEAMYFQGKWQGVGGTSIATPELAGFYAQANSYLFRMGTQCGGPPYTSPCSPMGLGAPGLYQFAVAQNQPPHNPFFDVTAGCIGGDIIDTFPTNGFCAGEGYDLASGWGSANMLQLSWAMNWMLEGAGTERPVVTLSSEATPNTLYTDQVPVTVTIGEPLGSRIVGIAGYTAQWDSDPGDPQGLSSPIALGTAGISSPFLSGPAHVFEFNTGGEVGDNVPLLEGCHTLYVRAWDNDGLGSSVVTAGPYCYASCTAPGQLVGDMQCGSTCCPQGDTCSTNAANPCCPSGQPACGDVCCGAGTTCIDAATSFCAIPVCAAGDVNVACDDGSGNSMCCAPGVNCCQGECCGPNEVCCGVLGCAASGDGCEQ